MLISGWSSDFCFFYKQKTAYEMRISDWSSDVCSSDLQSNTDEEWARTADILIGAAQRLEMAGATALVICANSMHKVYEQIVAAVAIPVLHIADAVGERMRADGIKNAALIGTSNVMTERFYRQRRVAHGIRRAGRRGGKGGVGRGEHRWAAS